MYRLFVWVPILALAVACNKPSAQEDDNHIQEDERVQHTLFTDHLELFIEHDPLVNGEETEILVHLTWLDNYQPCSTGTVTITMDGVSASTSQALRPGIFAVPFTPGEAGMYQATFSLTTTDVNEEAEEEVLVYASREEVHTEEGEEDDHSREESLSGEIEFLKEQAWQGRLMVKEILPGPFRASIATSGEIVAMPGEKKNVTASGQGIVRFADARLVQGSPVRKGQPLFTLSSETLVEDNVKLLYEEAKNRLENSRSRYERHRLLLAQEAISQRLYQESRSAYVEDSLRYYSLAANISEGGIKVLAPVSGTIHELMVSDGEFTEAGRILAILSTNRNLMLRADLPQQHFDQLGEIETAHFRPAYSDRVFTVEELNGSLLAAGVSVAENNHYLPVIFSLVNDGRLLEGAFAEVYLLTSVIPGVLTVPVGAVGEEQGAHYLFVQVTGESYTKRTVSLGRQNGLQVEVTGGLMPGERVVTDGFTLVRAASVATGEIGHGHTH